MKKLTLLTLSFLSVLTLAVLLLYTSCSKDKDQDKCTNVICQNGGTCIDGSCHCATGYSGTNCQTKIVADPCKGVTCQNGGTCASGTCNCVTGYEGTNCQTISRDKFIGSWAVNDNGTASGLSNYTITVNAASGNVTSVVIAGLYEVFIGSIVATINGTVITISSQQPDNDGYSVSGQGTLSADGKTVNMNYTVTNGVNTDTVTSVWHLQ